MPSPVPLPDSLDRIVAGYTWTPATEGASGASVYRLTALHRPTLYLKHATGAGAADVAAEAARLMWLAGRLPVPVVRQFVHTADAAALLTETLPGQSAAVCLTEHPEQGPAIVVALARFLRVVHALPLAECPFHAGHVLRMAEARQRIATGLVDPEDFDAERHGWTPEQVWSELVRAMPPRFERVVTHGDYTLDNVLIAEGRVVGCLDVGRAGAADPYQDLAALWNTLEEFGSDLQRALFPACGIAQPDERRLQFHLCLDEFF
jgi:aminoglycoside 3'-phosphotransferase-1